MNDLHAQAPGRQVRRGIAVVLLAMLAPPGTLVLLGLGCLAIAAFAGCLAAAAWRERPPATWVGR